jgi:hypothetical protein
MDTATRTRIDVANEVLQLFAAGTSIEKPKGGVFVTWERWRPPGKVTKRWQCRGSGFYPVWHRQWGHGGTACRALSQLVRWIQEKPVLPLSTWRFWTGKSVRLGRENGPRILELLAAGGYPESVNCVLCDQQITGSYDWWDLKGVSGPCCNHYSGCRQKSAAEPSR